MCFADLSRTVVCFFFFFFSSRRRHTRFDCDWSSDVCSSDLLFGAWRLGAALMPVNHKLQAPELQYILDHAQCKALVFDAALAPVVAAAPHPCARLVTEAQEAVPGVQDWDTLVAAARPMEGTRPADGDIAQVLYTSGTTGRPKGCLLSHRAVTLAAITAALGLSITREERTLMAMPI